MRKPTTRESVYLVVLAAIVIGYFVLGGSDVLTGGAGGSEAEALFIGEVPVVDVARLAVAPDEYDISGRNLFQYGSPPRVDRPVVKAPPPPPRAPPPKRTVPTIGTPSPPMAMQSAVTE